MAVIGITALKHRLQALKGVPGRLQEHWAAETAPIMRGYIHSRTGATAHSLRPTRRGVYGSPVVNFLNTGTKAHEEPLSRFTATGRVRRGKRAEAITGKTLKFSAGGKTLFRKKVSHPQTRGQHFKGEAMRRGLDQSGIENVVKTWNDAA